MTYVGFYAVNFIAQIYFIKEYKSSPSSRSSCIDLSMAKDDDTGTDVGINLSSLQIFIMPRQQFCIICALFSLKMPADKILVKPEAGFKK